MSFGKSKLIKIDVDLSVMEEIPIPFDSVEKLAEGVINGLNKNIIIDYANRLEQKPHDVIEVDVNDLEKTLLGLDMPMMYTYLYGGILQENMLPKLLSKRKVDFNDSVIWAVTGGVPEISFEVTRLPETVEEKKRIGKLNLYYKYEEKKLTIGAFVGYENEVELRARKIIVKFK